jgi:prepilin-type processing-associated H-X9-DG protein
VGVSVLEVLVTLTVLSLLVSLLLPAVQRVRSAAARISCQNNLKQIGLAAHNYESAFGKLPPAYMPPSTGTQHPYLQWPILLTPYLEQESLWTEAQADFRQSRDPILPKPHRGLARLNKSFMCPADERVSKTWDLDFHYTLARPKPLPVKIQVAVNSYIGNGGKLSPSRDGVIVGTNPVALLYITDGTSQTLAFGERPPPKNMFRGWVYVGWGIRGYGRLDSLLGVSDPNPFPKSRPEIACGPGPFPYQQPDLHAKDDCAFFQYWSLHSGGANFAFADGSVRFLSYSANAILPALATRAGGEVVEIPD